MGSYGKSKSDSNFLLSSLDRFQVWLLLREVVGFLVGKNPTLPRKEDGGVLGVYEDFCCLSTKKKHKKFPHRQVGPLKC